MFKNIYGRLGELRMPIKELAKRIGVNPKTLSNKLNGKTEFIYSEMLKIQKILGGENLDKLFTTEPKAS